MTRRGAVVAALVALAGRVADAQTFASVQTWKPTPPRLKVTLQPADNGLESLEVTDGTRTIVLSAKDIMDVLEGKA